VSVASEWWGPKLPPGGPTTARHNHASSRGSRDRVQCSTADVRVVWRFRGDSPIEGAAYDVRMTRYLHTMYRITDPDRSRAFYEALGLEFRRDMDIVRGGETEATNYFFGVPGQEEELELTFNHDGRTYELGTGYGHVALSVDDLADTLRQLAEQGIEPEREPYRVREGGSLLCFVRDPDGYRIELIDRSGR
jgi:lactoylglutathione lyase